MPRPDIRARLIGSGVSGLEILVGFHHLGVALGRVLLDLGQLGAVQVEDFRERHAIVHLVRDRAIDRGHEIIEMLGRFALGIGLVLGGHVQRALLATLLIVASLALIAAIDVPYQLWEYHRKLRMSKEDVRQEMKEQEGDPQIKARIRAAQREMSRRRMMTQVPTADVVVTNPTHYSVALKYDPERSGAPVVVAKGMNLIAHNIRDLAREHGVPILEAPPLARALYAHCELEQQIPAQLYTVVAEVMAWVSQPGQMRL